MGSKINFKRCKVYQNKEKFKRYYFVTTFAVIAAIVMAFGIGFVVEEHRNFEETLRINRINLLESKKETLKGVVDSVAQQVSLSIDDSERLLGERIDERLNIAYEVAMSNYNIAKDDADARRDIKAALSGMVWGNNYVFIFDTDGYVISSPIQKHLEGRNILESPNKAMRETMLSSIQKLKTAETVSAVSPWRKPDSKEVAVKHYKLRVFRPLNWVIGYGEYVDDFTLETQQKIIKQLESIKLPEDGYIFMADYNGTSLTKPAKGKLMLNIQDSDGKYIVKDMIALAKMGGGFYEYQMPPFPGLKPETKLSYVTGIKGWNWYVGTGIYLTDFENTYAARMKEARKDARKELIMMMALLSAVLAVSGVITLMMSNRMEKLINRHSKEMQRKNEELRQLNTSLETKVQEKTAELTALNSSLEQRIREEIEKNREQEHIMFQQGRLAAMGEMLSNIAHQWRQPLNNIGLYIQDIQDAHETGRLDNEYMNRSADTCLDIIQHMSLTIDNFRDFFKPDKERVLFDVNDCIRHSITLLVAGIENSRIGISTDLKAVGKVTGVPGEYSQVLINIITNAKDALINSNSPNPQIKIRSFSSNGTVTVEIEDNAGGIPAEICDKIFQPYFTTKQDGQGTGIGLYFSKIIIEKNMGGKISFSNSDSGATFSVQLPETAEESSYL